ncbi:MAG: selenide, water dikinase SelD [Myxococcales bacterium]|nr:selenide, water dikinase SelD [Myxococcales bacterium]
MDEPVRLTQYSHGAGCGCKIAPNVLDAILRGGGASGDEAKHLLVGNGTRDDAAAYDLGDGTAVLSTTDFFMPIVDDPGDFGRIAAANALSDIYAMGGRPLMAIALLGWPLDTLPAEVAGRVLGGARGVCADAGIPLAGGHSIDSPEPIFGLAVTGRVKITNLKTNAGARPGASLYLTKPLGVGILTTAEKKGLLKPEHAGVARNAMLKLNSAGALFGELSYVEAMTDVTGFGLLGHLAEMCRAADVSAELVFDRIPLLDRAALVDYVERGAVPGGTQRNADSLGDEVPAMTDLQRAILCDPQTSGGLLVAVTSGKEAAFEKVADDADLELWPIGRVTTAHDHLVRLD